MALKRTPIARKTPLVRRAGLSQGPRRSLDGARVKTSRRRRDTGPSSGQRALVTDRAGWCCEICGRRLGHHDTGWTHAHSHHHRQPRALGGSSRPEANAAYNLLLLCGTGTTGCHGQVEADREHAEELGWLVRHGLDPAEVPVYVTGYGAVLLTPDGRYAPVVTV